MAKTLEIVGETIYYDSETHFVVSTFYKGRHKIPGGIPLLSPISNGYETRVDKMYPRILGGEEETSPTAQTLIEKFRDSHASAPFFPSCLVNYTDELAF